MNNFRVTTDYILEFLNSTDSLYYSIWIKGNDGNPTIYVSEEADTTSTEIDWDYVNFQLPVPIDDYLESSNYRITEDGSIQIKNTENNLYYTIYIYGTDTNPYILIGKYGEE